MQRQYVVSSNLKSIGYDPESKILEIEFQNGSVYQYYGVPRSLYEGLMGASSHGKYFHQYIKDNFPYQKVK